MPIANFTLPGASAPSFPEAAKAPSAASGYAAPPATVSVSCAAFAHRSPPRWSCLPAIGSRCVGTGAARSAISGRSLCMFAMSPFRSRFMRSPQPSAVTVRQLAMPATWSRIAATIQRSTNSSRSSNGPSRLYFVRTECSAMSDANRAMVKLLRFLARGQRGSRHARVLPGRCSQMTPRITSFPRVCWPRPCLPGWSAGQAGGTAYVRPHAPISGVPPP